jgi:myo-inositol 2-dehydrogenase/D-chiro-inositol 1-dehydrogenase
VSFRLAPVGAGRIGSFHAQALADSASVKLAAVVDPVVAGDGGASANIPHFPSIADLVEREQVDGALVAVPTRSHRAVIAELASAGIRVLCEKPCGMTARESETIAAETENVGGFLRIAYWRRYVPDLAALRERLHAGEFGDLFSLFSAQWDEYPPSASFRDPSSSGGICVDLGVHDFDLLRWLTDQEIEAVAGHASAVHSADPVPGDPESAALIVRLSGGTTGLISLGRRHPPGELQSIQVIGTGDAVQITYVDRSGSPMVLEAFRRQTDDFAREVEGARTELATARDALRALQAAELAGDAIQPDVYLNSPPESLSATPRAPAASTTDGGS